MSLAQGSRWCFVKPRRCERQRERWGGRRLAQWSFSVFSDIPLKNSSVNHKWGMQGEIDCSISAFRISILNKTCSGNGGEKSLCQKQCWHSGSGLHISCFSYLISKNTFFSFFCIAACMFRGHECALTLKEKGNTFNLGYSLHSWPFTLEMYHVINPRAFLC